MVPQRASRRPVGRAWPALQSLDSQRDVAGSQRSKSEFGHGWTEQRHDWGAHRRRQMQGRAVVGHEQRGSPDQRRGLAQRETSAGVYRPRPPLTALDRPHDLIAQRSVVRTTDDHYGRCEFGGELGVVRPTLTAPNRPRRQSDKVSADQPVRHLLIFRGGPQVGTIEARRAIGEGQQTIGFVTRSGFRPGLCIEEGPAAREANSSRDAREHRQRGAAQGSMREIRLSVGLLPKPPRQRPQSAPTTIRAALVVRENLPDRGMSLEQRSRQRCGHHVHRAMPLRQRGQERRRKNDVSEESRLNDECGGAQGS